MYVLGAAAGQALLAAGEIDEIVVHLVQVLLGGGRRLFAESAERVELEPVRRLRRPGRHAPAATASART